MVSGVEAKQAMTTKAIILQIPGALPVTKAGRFDKGPQSVWEAPNAVMVNISNFDHTIATLRRIIQEHRHASNPSQPASDPVEQLQRWAALRDQGILTEEEFQHQKRKLLGM
jgi:putative oligomerization/nucleic acid binding protein